MAPASVFALAVTALASAQTIVRPPPTVTAPIATTTVPRIPLTLACKTGMPIDTTGARCMKVVWSKRFANEDGNQSVMWKPDSLAVDWQGGRAFVTAQETNTDYGTYRYRLRAFRVNDGGLAWEKTTTPPAGDFGPLAYASGRVIEAVTEGLLAFDSATGAQVWRAPTQANVNNFKGYSTTWLAASGQDVYAPATFFDPAMNANRNYLQVVDGATGNERWKIDMGSIPKAPIVIGAMAFGVMGNKGLVGLNLSTHAITWSVSPLGLSSRALGFYVNRVYGGVSAQIYAFDSATGTIVRKYPLPKCVVFTQPDFKGAQFCPTELPAVVSPIAFYGSTALFVTDKDELLALKTDTGEIAWAASVRYSGFAFQNSLSGGLSIVNGVMAVPGTTMVRFFDVSDGEQLAAVDLAPFAKGAGPRVIQMSVAPDGRVLVRLNEDLMLLAPAP